MNKLEERAPAFLKHWEDDPYAVARTAALRWLGDRYLLAEPVRRRLTEPFFMSQSAEQEKI